MKRIEAALDTSLCMYPLEKLGKKEEILFVDIETTGFTAKTSALYMIGCIVYETEWKIIQLMSENPTQQAQILQAFLSLLQGKKTIITYNGDNFDIPYLKNKCKQFGLQSPLDGLTSIDLYKCISPFKKLLGLENCKQKTVEQFLDIERDDKFHGGELISIYNDYCATKSSYAYNVLLLHNADDMRGMMRLTDLIAYHDLSKMDFRVVKVQSNKYKDYFGNTKEEVLIKMRLNAPLPRQLTLGYLGCALSVTGDEAFIKVPIVRGEFKYFYDNYKDYYYLPNEDISLHKSVAGYVSKEFRKPATARTCYTRKEGVFLPQYDCIFEPVFKTDYDAKEAYFELTGEFKKSQESFQTYAAHLVGKMLG